MRLHGVVLLAIWQVYSHLKQQGFEYKLDDYVLFCCISSNAPVVPYWGLMVARLMLETR